MRIKQLIKKYNIKSRPLADSEKLQNNNNLKIQDKNNKMHKKLTTRKDQHQHRNMGRLQQLQNQRIYSFSQQSPRAAGYHNNKISHNTYNSNPNWGSDSVNIFTCQLLPNVLLINSSDSHMVESTLRDKQLDNKIRNRMNKYLYVLDYIQCAHQNQQYCFNAQTRTQNYAESQSHGFQTQDEVIQNQSIFSNVKTNSREQTKNNTAQINRNKQCQQKYKNNQKISQNRNFTTSRYLNEKNQKQNVVKTKNLNLSKQQSKSRSKNKSVLSTNSKPFQKIQLKSVKRVNQKQKDIKQMQKNLQKQFSQKDERKDKQKKNQKQTKVDTNTNKNQALINKNKRYTISHRDNIVRRDQAVSNQISQIKQNSRIIVSRVKNHQSSKSQQKNKPISRSRFKADQVANGCSPRNCKQRCSTCERCQRCERCDRNRISRMNHSRLHFRESFRENRLRDLQMEFQSNHHNLVQQTVQKSSDFLQMIRMMSQQ